MVANATTEPQLVSDELIELAQSVISTFVEDHLADLLLSGGEPARRSSRRGCWPRTFGFTWSMVLLASRHRICIVDMSYTKHFVWNALPEERAAGCRQSVGGDGAA